MIRLDLTISDTAVLDAVRVMRICFDLVLHILKADKPIFTRGKFVGLQRLGREKCFICNYICMGVDRDLVASIPNLPRPPPHIN
jgi:hypothetical protein